eukprot:5816113-Prymnesium_polylepis.1
MKWHCRTNRKSEPTFACFPAQVVVYHVAVADRILPDIRWQQRSSRLRKSPVLASVREAKVGPTAGNAGEIRQSSGKAVTCDGDCSHFLAQRSLQNGGDIALVERDIV